jgi:tetratricopeptide (TPR) repeat protein
MPFSYRKAAIVFLTITLGVALNSAYGQEERNPRLGYGVGYNHMGEQYLKNGVCDLVPHGNITRASENLALAEQAFQEAILVDPACVEAHLNLARLFHLKQEFDEATTAYEQAIRLTPDDVNVLVDMALLQIEMDRTDEAVRYLEQAKRLARDERTLQHLNRFVRRSGRPERSAVRQVNGHPSR